MQHRSGEYSALVMRGYNRSQRNAIREKLIRKYLADNNIMKGPVTATEIVEYFNLPPREASTFTALLKKCYDTPLHDKTAGFQVRASSRDERTKQYCFTIQRLTV